MTTTEEHPGLQGPLDELAHRYGVVVRAVPAADVMAGIGPATRMVAVSHVLWTTGLILPMAEISAAARAVGATLLVDGAQSGGAIPLDMAATGADFYAVSGQKWLLGPQGTGALWVHPRQHERLRPATPSYFTYADGHVGPLRAGARGSTRAASTRPCWPGSRPRMEWVEGLPGGRAAWFELAAERAAAARRRLAGVPGVEVHDPGGPCSGLIALRLQGHESPTRSPTWRSATCWCGRSPTRRSCASRSAPGRTTPTSRRWPPAWRRWPGWIEVPGTGRRGTGLVSSAAVADATSSYTIATRPGRC